MAHRAATKVTLDSILFLLLGRVERIIWPWFHHWSTRCNMACRVKGHQAHTESTNLPQVIEP